MLLSQYSLSLPITFPGLNYTKVFATACCFELQPSFLAPNGDRVYGSLAIVCNFSKTLVHAQVITLFHELGHGMHQLLSRTRYAKFHGSRFTKDFIEIPSILLENWCWLPAQLKRLSRHCDTGATIPDDLVNNLVRTKHFVRVLDPFQVALAMFDLVVYTPISQKEADEMNPSEIYNKLLCEITGLEGPKPTAGARYVFLQSRSHFMTNIEIQRTGPWPCSKSPSCVRLSSYILYLHLQLLLCREDLEYYFRHGSNE